MREMLRGWRRRLSALARGCRIRASGAVRRVPIESLTNEFGFSFAPQGWNYFRALVAEHQAHPERPLPETTFGRFFQHEQVRAVRCLNDLLWLHKPGSPDREDGRKFYLGTYPWSDHVGGGPWGHWFDEVEGRMTRDLYGYRANIWHTPGDPHPVEIEWNMTLQTIESLRSGYHPMRWGDWPQVTLLVRRSGEYRAVRYNGQHRLAVLSHRGVRSVAVVVPQAAAINRELESWTSASALPKRVSQEEIVVREEQVDRWPYVERGWCSREQALHIFHAFFELNGRERIRFLGLPPMY